ncbi:expressed unknown protein [Seminavis robusta]|uniref:Uncharacterized protein n=1 Tax=Seminavis robusta TaxID=568900 RepID=A0A9N8D9L7_9STRA|nr:expressed unknown protein [Seminavis robusta]|eukprot:Sro25_g016880.1 n/a (384) ;mRNA; r:60259-61410
MSAMKSLPHTPVASTASTITATMMAKAFQKNHHKRGLGEMMAPPPTPTAYPSNNNSSSSYLDCQSLQSSLKRVRLSSSPGELRLQRDLRHMVSSGTWVPQQDNRHKNSEVWMWHPPAPPVTVKAHNQPPPPHIELKKVESLRLRLTFQHSVVAWIQVPRMYPHRPPLISRIVYQDNYGGNNNNTKQTIQTIVVHEAPPGRSDGASVISPEDQPHQIKNNANPIHQGNTVVYHNWSPVQRLGDLLEFVIDTFRKQHNEIHGTYNINLNNRRHSCANDVSLTYSSSSLSSNSSWSRRSSGSSITTAASANTAGYRTSSSSLFPGWNNKEEQHSSDVSMITTTHSNLASAFLTPNRFDIGYDRVVPPATMDLDTVGIPQQVSMMDL